MANPPPTGRPSRVEQDLATGLRQMQILPQALGAPEITFTMNGGDDGGSSSVYTGDGEPSSFLSTRSDHTRSVSESSDGSRHEEGLDDLEDDAGLAGLSESEKQEYKRQIHVLSEHKRRQQINEGFEHLERVLPHAGPRRVSKPIMIQKTVLHIRQLQANRQALADESIVLHDRLEAVKQLLEEIRRARNYDIKV